LKKYAAVQNHYENVPQLIVAYNGGNQQRGIPPRQDPRAGGEGEDNIGQTTTNEEKNSKGNSIRFAIQVQ